MSSRNGKLERVWMATCASCYGEQVAYNYASKAKDTAEALLRDMGWQLVIEGWMCPECCAAIYGGQS